VLVQALVDRGYTLTVCPLSNEKLNVIDNLNQHPIAAMLGAGLKATINSDDPGYFGGYLNDNFRALIDHKLIDRDQLYTLLANGFDGVWMDDTRRLEQRRRLDLLFSGAD